MDINNVDEFIDLSADIEDLTRKYFGTFEEHKEDIVEVINDKKINNFFYDMFEFLENSFKLSKQLYNNFKKLENVLADEIAFEDDREIYDYLVVINDNLNDLSAEIDDAFIKITHISDEMDLEEFRFNNISFKDMKENLEFLYRKVKNLKLDFQDSINSEHFNF